MTIILLFTSRPGAGANTIAVNLATGLIRHSYRVLLSGACENPGLGSWLEGPEDGQTGLLKKNPGLKWRRQLKAVALDEVVNEGCDIFIYIMGKGLEPLKYWASHRILTICTIEAGKVDFNNIIILDENIRHFSGGAKRLDLVVSNKVQPGEWNQNSNFIFELAEHLGWDRMADPIPYCEAIHDLSLDNKSIWDLPSQYRNRQDAFQRLVERVLELI